MAYKHRRTQDIVCRAMSGNSARQVYASGNYTAVRATLAKRLGTTGAVRRLPLPACRDGIACEKSAWKHMKESVPKAALCYGASGRRLEVLRAGWRVREESSCL